MRHAARRQARATALMRVHTELQRTLLGGRGRAALRGGAAPAAATLDAVRLLQLWDLRGPPAPEVCPAKQCLNSMVINRKATQLHMPGMSFPVAFVMFYACSSSARLLGTALTCELIERDAHDATCLKPASDLACRSEQGWMHSSARRCLQSTTGRLVAVCCFPGMAHFLRHACPA